LLRFASFRARNSSSDSRFFRIFSLFSRRFSFYRFGWFFLLSFTRFGTRNGSSNRGFFRIFSLLSRRFSFYRFS
jgi:hypothetical protein